MKAKKIAKAKIGDQVVSIDLIHLSPINPRHDIFKTDDAIRELVISEK